MQFTCLFVSNILILNKLKLVTVEITATNEWLLNEVKSGSTSLTSKFALEEVYDQFEKAWG